MVDPLIVAERILAAVARAHGFTTADLLGRDRHQPVCHARQVAIYLLRQFTKLSWLAIARLVGRDHSTCISASRRARNDILTNGPRRAIVMAALKQLDDEARA